MWSCPQQNQDIRQKSSQNEISQLNKARSPSETIYIGARWIENYVCPKRPQSHDSLSKTYTHDAESYTLGSYPIQNVDCTSCRSTLNSSPPPTLQEGTTCHMDVNTMDAPPTYTSVKDQDLRFRPYSLNTRRSKKLTRSSSCLGDSNWRTANDSEDGAQYSPTPLRQRPRASCTCQRLRALRQPRQSPEESQWNTSEEEHTAAIVSTAEYTRSIQNKYWVEVRNTEDNGDRVPAITPVIMPPSCKSKYPSNVNVPISPCSFFDSNIPRPASCPPVSLSSHFSRGKAAEPSDSQSSCKCNGEMSTRPGTSADPEADATECFSFIGQIYPITTPSDPPSALARLVASKIIRYARHNRDPHESAMMCPDCGVFPELPVTGACGHTRCTKCIEDRGPCPCGAPAPKKYFVNTLIQELIKKLVPTDSLERLSKQHFDVQNPHEESPAGDSGSWFSCAADSRGLRGSWKGGGVRRRPARLAVHRRAAAARGESDSALISPQRRVQAARALLAARRYQEAAAQLARAAAAPAPRAFSRLARRTLTQTIELARRSCSVGRLTRGAYRCLRRRTGAGKGSQLAVTSLECALCYHPYTRPVTTPCGHNYCRTCIERAMDYKKTCALCLRSLDDFDLAATRETAFICAALESVGALRPPPPSDPDVIPIFVCTVAYPTIPCPLFIFDPRYWLMIRRVLESGSRKFGMVTCARGRAYCDYGTVLEVRDCVHLEDGRSILSTVGVSRFKIIERDERDGCEVARIQPLTDVAPSGELAAWEVRAAAARVACQALLWLDGMQAGVRAEIEAAFGPLPPASAGRWWASPDGPAWLWWLVAILPLKLEIKVLILSTQSLLKRLMAVSRTLEVVERAALTASSSKCSLRDALSRAETWLHRGA